MELEEPSSSDDIKVLTDKLYEIDQGLIDNQGIGDVDLTIKMRSGVKEHKSSTIFFKSAINISPFLKPS